MVRGLGGRGEESCDLGRRDVGADIVEMEGRGEGIRSTPQKQHLGSRAGGNIRYHRVDT